MSANSFFFVLVQKNNTFNSLRIFSTKTTLASKAAISGLAKDPISGVRWRDNSET
jgi:hypothetical protein